MIVSPSKFATLHITAADDATEIFLIDANLNRIDSGLGELQAKVIPGVYKVRFRSGAIQSDKLVEILSANDRVTIQGPPILFRTAVPIDKTLTTHEYQSKAAEAASKHVNCRLGSGGELFVFVREENEDQSFSLKGISVNSLDGIELATFDDGDIEFESRCGALNLKIDPGTYSIRVESGRAGVYEIFVTVSFGWQTQVFMVMDEIWYERTSVRVPVLRSVSVLMSRCGIGFSSSGQASRLTELARQALEQGRDIVSSQLMNKLLYGKYENPMLGVIAAHLILLKHRPDWELLGVVINNLRNILGEHPDVQALQIAMKNRFKPQVDFVDNPPLLRKSWDYIAKASRRRASIVRPNSCNARIADEVIAGGPFLLHRFNREAQSVKLSIPNIAESFRLVEQLVEIDSEQLKEIVKNIHFNKQSLSGLERGVLSSVMSQVQAKDLEVSEKDISVKAEAQQVLSGLNAPKYSIANAVISLTDKMKVSWK